MNDGLALNLVPASAGSLAQFIQAATQAPYLSAEQERALALRLRHENDLGAARELVLSHLRHVVHVARRYNGYGLPLADLIQEGSIGLMKAVRRFDPDRGVRLVSFAVHWIRAEIHDYVLRNWSIVKIATTKAQRKLFFNLRRHKPRGGWLTAAQADQVARDLGVTRADVLEMDARMGQRAVSFDPLNEDDDSAPPSPAETLTDDSMRPDVALEDSQCSAREARRLHASLATLDARSREIVEARWLRSDKRGLQELGSQYGISAERVRQIEQQAMKRLQRVLAQP